MVFYFDGAAVAVTAAVAVVVVAAAADVVVAAAAAVDVAFLYLLKCSLIVSNTVVYSPFHLSFV